VSKKGEHAHHGGAWKVAYADFVTALMALFIVLWMMNSSAAVKKSVTGYFRDPRGYTQRLGAGPANAGEGLRVEARTVKDVREQLEQALRQMPEYQRIRNNIQFSVTGEGLRVDLLETEQGLFFVTGNAARRLLHQYGVRPEQVVEVRGFADQKQMYPQDPNDPRNRRISVVIRFQP
jgi:chemotaxis protein MotB